MKNTVSSGSGNLRPRFLNFVSAVLFVLGLTLAFWIATAPVVQAANPTPGPSPSSPTPTPGPGHQPCVVCHTAKPNPHEITIDCNALEQHLRNHPEDKAGPCPKTSPTPSPSATPTPGKGHQKCTVCHKPAGPHPQTLTIDCHALQAHLDHGDYEGPCQVTRVTNP